MSNSHYIRFWLHNNSHAEKWKTFVEAKIGKQLQKEKMYGLAFFSFMIVFREAFESILFLQAINLETISKNKSAIGFGALAAFGLIAFLGVLFLKYSKKIPVRQLFLYSSWGNFNIGNNPAWKGDSFLPRIRLDFHHKYSDFWAYKLIKHLYIN